MHSRIARLYSVLCTTALRHLPRYPTMEHQVIYNLPHLGTDHSLKWPILKASFETALFCLRTAHHQSCQGIQRASAHYQTSQRLPVVLVNDFLRIS